VLTAFKKHIQTNFAFIKGKKILLAISGGIDSVVLAHLFSTLKLEFAFAHCNFGLRGNDADNDEQFVKELGHQFNVSVYTKSFNTKKYAKEHKLSIQMAARELRYDWFDTLLIENPFSYIVTGHHLNDNLETFLINFTRGTGLNGLTGIPEKNGNIIRPLLPFSRDEIENFATENNIIWHEDHSNAQTKYKRNKIRHQIIPLLKELNPNLLSSFKETTIHLKESQEIVNIAIEELKKVLFSPATEGVQKINIHKIKELSNHKAYLFELLKNYGFTEWDDVTNLLEAQPGKQLFSKTHRLLKDRDFILLTEINSAKANVNQYEVKKGQKSIELEKVKLVFRQTKHLETKVESKDIVFINMDKLQFPLQLRRWEKGDYFYPLGMNGKKKLSKFFKDEKFSLVDKENTWLLCSADDIVWVLGKRLDDRFKINNNTKNIVRIDLIKA
jgi:tRNA(Ile)-lysidine synthase